MASTMARICGDGLSEGRRREIASIPEWKSVVIGDDQLAQVDDLSSSVEADDQTIIVLADQLSDERMTHYFSAPFTGFVELTEGESLDEPNSFISKVGQDDNLVVSVRSQTAYGLSLARHIVAAVQERIDVTPEAAMDMELALHELMANSLIHGNLEISSDLRQTFEQSEAYLTLVTERLEPEHFGSRRLNICAQLETNHVTVRIQDHGPGFEPRAVSASDETKASGRGLEIVRSLSESLEFEDSGRHVVIRFKVN